MKIFLYSLATDQRQGGVYELLKFFLWLLSGLYWMGNELIKLSYKIGFYRRYRLSRPVISIGNLTMGGTGKTPLVEWLARALRTQGQQPVILTRGYMPKRKGETDGFSDEAELLKANLKDIPVLVGADRVQGARQFLEHGQADVFILDDGFQHWRLERQVEIVVLDATNPWGNRQLIPRGILREPLVALKRADIIVLTRTDLGERNLEEIHRRLSNLVPQIPVFKTVHQPAGFTDLRTNSSKDASSLRDQPVVSLCSIGSSRTFAQTLISLKCSLLKNFAFEDHHVYTPEDIKKIADFCRGKNIKTIVTTQKDAVKLNNFLTLFDADMTLLSLRIRIIFPEGEDRFLERVNHLLRR